MDREKLQEILDEKLYYLFVSTFKGKYDLMSLSVSDISMKDGEIYEMDIDLKVDSLKACDGHAWDISNMLKTTDEDIREFLYRFPVNPKTGQIDIKYSDNIQVSDGLYLNIEYSLDEKHYFLLTYRIDYQV